MRTPMMNGTPQDPTLPDAARRRLLRGLGAGAALAPLLGAGGCALAPVFSSSNRVTRLSAAAEFAPGPTLGWQLLVGQPAANVSLNTTRIAFTSAKGGINYFSAEWDDPLPAMVQTLVIESFENSGRIMAVARDTSGLRADYILMLDIRDFSADYGDGAPEQTAPTVKVGLRAKLVAMPRRMIEESALFEARAVAASPAFGDIASAFDAAFHDVARRLTEWTLQPGRRAG